MQWACAILSSGRPACPMPASVTAKPLRPYPLEAALRVALQIPHSACQQRSALDAVGSLVPAGSKSPLLLGCQLLIGKNNATQGYA